MNDKKVPKQKYTYFKSTNWQILNVSADGINEYFTA